LKPYVEERDVGTFQTIPAIVLSVNGGKACFPKVPNEGHPRLERLHDRVEKRAALWRKMEWFESTWIPRGQVQKMLKDAVGCSNERAVEVFDYHTTTMYTAPFQAVCIAQMMPGGRSLREFCPLVREAFLGFYSGYRATSIAALIPIIEGSLTTIVADSGHSTLTIQGKVDRAIEGAVSLAASLYFERMWVPREYKTTEFLIGLDERVLVFETFRRWLLNSFFRKTSDYDGVTWLNRHLFAHGVSSSWQQSANFQRLVIAVATLGVVESWYDGSNAVSLLFPDMDENSNLLWQQALSQVEVQMLQKAIEEKRYHEHGRLVPELPTDDGATFRRALLSDDCMNDLVRSLRDAGWSVEVDEPEEHGLYMTVRASAGDARLNAALLYSCATTNETYRALAEKADVILYRGAPYHQDEYAYGLDVHVGPVTGWKPPAAPS